MKKISFLLLMFSVAANLFAKQDTIVVARDGTGKFATITAALESVRAFMDFNVSIYLKKGVYKEKVIIPSWLENIDIIGEDKDSTIIVYADHANINRMGTFRTYTLKVEGNNVTFRNLTIENNAPQLGQAVALHTEGDRLRFINCRFLGNQDTVYTGMPRTRLYFKDCYIEGTTDFIFGPSTAIFDDCHIHCKKNSYITAASTPEDVKYGYVFRRCRITAADGVNKVYLGRPWRPYAYTLFMECELGGFILPEGWHDWNNKDNEYTARYLEYHNHGKGSDNKKRVLWSHELANNEAREITIENIYSINNNWSPF